MFTTLMLTGVIWILQALRFVDEIINYDMSASAFFYISFLLLPQLLPVTMPIGLFVGMLYGYWRMSSDSEIVVMRAAGLSRLSLAKPGLLIAGISAVIVATMTFYLWPVANQTMRDTRFAWRYIYSNLVIREGQFAKVGEHVTVYVRKRGSDGALLNLLIDDRRDPRKQVTMMAENGLLVRDEKGPQIMLLNGSRQERDPESGHVSFLNFDRYNLVLDLGGDDKPLRSYRKLEEYTFWQLVAPSETESKERRHALWAEAHKRVALPLLCLVFALISMAAILSGQLDRRGHILRIWVACIAAGIVQAGVLMLSQSAAKTPWLVAPLYLLIALGCTIPLYLLTQHRFVRRDHGEDRDHPAGETPS